MRGFRLNDGRVAAVWLSALVFGLAHVLPAVALFAFGGGLIWGRYVAKGGSLWATVFAHAVTNSMPFLFLLLDGNRPSPTGVDMRLQPLTALPFLGIAVLLTYVYFRRNPLPAEPAPARPERSIPLFLTLVGLGIALVFALGQSLAGPG